MSLLLDALRRAEEARRAKEVEANATPAKPVVATGKPARSQTKPAAPLRELTMEELAPASTPVQDFALEEMSNPDVEPYSGRAALSESARSRNAQLVPEAREVTQRDAVRNVFAAKQSGTQLPADNGKRKWIVPLVAVAVTMVGAGAWYVWNEVSRVSQPAIARAPLQTPALPPASPNIGQAGSKPPGIAPASDTKVAEPALPPLLPPPLAAAPVPKIGAPAGSASERLLTKREALAKRLRDAPTAKEAPTGLKLARSLEPPKVSPELALAYQSLANGNYADAQKRYSTLVGVEPLNIDAHLGLATAAARGGDKAFAVQHYRQVLVLDPRNGLAIMGLVALNEGAPSATLEIELRTLVGRNPDAAPLHFALGNLYAGESRWTEAQQAFFEAFRIEPANPDYLFNLAVSLDQLRQRRLALDYYKKADAISAAKGGGQFDRNTLAKRINELGAETGRTN
jgi:tetratricopeptide (TPR) repeat protein